jgi:hypothetical protein
MMKTCAALVAAAALLTSGVAHADRVGTGDDAYLRELGVYGFTVTAEHSQTMVVVGHAICTDLQSGVSSATETAAVFHVLPNISETQARNVVTVAQMTLCSNQISV